MTTQLRVKALTTAQVQRVAKERLIGRAALCEAMGITRQSLLERVKRGTFPAPIVEFGGTFVWDITQVQKHLPS